MPIPKTEHELAQLFAQLGANEPAAWAASEVKEGIPQMLRFLFLREAWRYVEDENDSAWIDREIDRTRRSPGEPFGQLGAILARCREAGVSDQDLTDMARCHQVAMMFHMCYMLHDGPKDVPDVLEDIGWSLFSVDDENRPVGDAIDGLHESVLDLDPTGREMRPR